MNRLYWYGGGRDRWEFRGVVRVTVLQALGVGL
jgi:hypothetical protein